MQVTISAGPHEYGGIDMPGRTIVVVTAVLASCASTQELRLDPRPDSVIAKHVEARMILVLDDIRMVINGVDQDMSGVGSSSMEAELGYQVQAVDQYVATTAGAFPDLMRTYDEFAGWIKVDAEPSQEFDWPDRSGSLKEAISHAMRFAWDPETQAHVLQHGDDGQHRHVPGFLAADLDLTDFLPDHGISKGDTWIADDKALICALIQGVDPALIGKEDWERHGFDGEVWSEIATALLTYWEVVVVHCTYEGEEQGARGDLARIKITCEVKEPFEPFAERAKTKELGDILEFLPDLTLVGSLLWDLDAGIPRSFEMHGEGTVTMRAYLVFSEGYRSETSVDYSVVLERRTAYSGHEPK